MYEYMNFYHGGICALEDAVVLLSHKRADSMRFEVGGRTDCDALEVLRVYRYRCCLYY